MSDEGDVLLAFKGACASCPAQAMTFGAAVMPAIEHVPGVRAITANGMNVSPAAMRRIRTMFGSADNKKEV